MLPSLQNLQAFVAAVETGQLRRAAWKLNLTESAISHQIRKLEAFLGARLLLRDRSGVKLTPEGELFLDHARSALWELEQGMKKLSRSQNETVTITAPRTFAAMWLAARLQGFYARYPDVEIRIITTDRLCDLEVEDIDFAFRVEERQDEQREGFLLCDQLLTPVCNRSLAEEIRGQSPAEVLRNYPLLLNEVHSDEWELWCRAQGVPLPEGKAFRRLKGYDLVQTACLEGAGIAMGRAPLWDGPLQAGLLHRIWSQRALRDGSYWVLQSRALLENEAAKAFHSWIGDQRLRRL